MYTDRWMDLWNNIHSFNNLRSRTAQLLPKIEAIAYTRKRQAKQPCLDTKGATESDGFSSSLRMDDIYVGQMTKAATLHDSSNDSDSDSINRLSQWRGPFESN